MITAPDYSSLDAEAIAAAIGLKSKHIPRLVASFVEESTMIMGKLEEAIAARHYDEIAEYAHSLKGSSGNLRLNELYELAKSMELAAKEASSDFAYEEVFAAIKAGVGSMVV